MANKRYVYTVQQTKAIEQQCSSKINLPERAARACYEQVVQHYPNIKWVLILLGQGNNALDGVLMAKILHNNGFRVSLCLCVAGPISGVIHHHIETLSEQGVKVLKAWPEVNENYDLIVDAVIGIGLNRPISGDLAKLFHQVNLCKQPVVAIDIPSGIHADSGEVMGVALKSELCIGLITHKFAYYSGCSLNYQKKTVVEYLGTKPYQALQQPMLAIVGYACKKYLLQSRPVNSHKGQMGRVIVFSGANENMLGAPLLSAIAATKIGCGQVVFVTTQSNASTVACIYPFLTVITYDYLAQHHDFIRDQDIFVLGPGFGTSTSAANLFAELMTYNNRKVLDADALLLLKQGSFYHLGQNVIITPHPKEAQVLLASSQEHHEALKRLIILKQLIKKYGCYALLKGAGTVMGSPNSERLISVCEHKSPSMAVAGMGDVLAGMIAALWSMGQKPYDALQLGVTWHAQLGVNLADPQQVSSIDVSDFVARIRTLLPR